MRYINTDGQNMDFEQLTNELDDQLKDLSIEEGARIYYTNMDQKENIHLVVMAYDRGRPIGCIAIKHNESRTAEIVRFYVRSNYRGQGIGHQLIKRMEPAAKKLRYNRLAMGLIAPLADTAKIFREFDYVEDDNCDMYQDMPEVTCLTKVINSR